MERDYSTKCSKCGERAVVLATVPYVVQVDNDGRKYDIAIPDLVVPRCAKCGNIVLHGEANSRITAEFRKIAGLLTPEEIRFHRERVGLSQEELAEHLGTTVLTLSRWELGELIQPRSLDRFLRAILTMPELRKTLADKDALELSSVG
jgi:putative zinc finger/helix-turn-helix YgiT family protein